MYGKSGTGKSVAAALVIRAWLNEWALTEQINVPNPHGEWGFVGCAELVMKIQAAWRDESTESAYRILKKLAEMPRLVLDDLGTEKPTDFVRQAIHFLINEREAWERQTVITSNFGLEQIDQQYDQRIGSRIAGMCDVRPIRGRDRRVMS